MKQIFLENLPRKGTRIDWINSTNYEIKFIYEDIKSSLTIINYNKGKRMLLVKYNDNEYNIAPNNLSGCKLGNILGVITSSFKIEIGQVFKDDKRDLVIINREYRAEKDKNNKIHNYKWYQYHCNKCSYEHWIIESCLLNQQHGCACCSNQIIVKGINDIATTHPYLIKYFVDINDSHIYSYGSTNKILFKCPDCGHEKYSSIGNLFKKGICCPKCSDGVSYPEKVMTSVLEQLFLNCSTQLSKTTFKWCEKFRYDFYLNDYNCIIETHGNQHYIDNGFGRCNEKENDKLKYKLALDNGIENYIVIDCRESNLEFIKQSILNSKLSKMFDLSIIDWSKVEEVVLSSRVKDICNLWNKGIYTISQLSKEVKLSRPTIIKYLKQGNEIGWCKYIIKGGLLNG